MGQRRWALVAVFVALGGTGCASDGDNAPRTADGTVTVKSPAADATVAWPAKLVMTAEGVEIEPVGDAPAREGAGHYHVMVDTDCAKGGTAIPRDAAHIHFGTGASTLTLGSVTPGRHELCVQVGDGVHSALDATTSVAITIGPVTQKAWRETANAMCKPKGADVERRLATFNTAHPGLIDGSGTATAEQRVAALDDFWDFFEGLGTEGKPITDAIVALPYPDTPEGKAAHERLEAAVSSADAFGTQLLRDRPRDIFDRLAAIDRAGPFANLNKTWEDLEMFECI